MSEVRRIRLGEIITVEHGFAFPGEFFSSDLKFPTLVTPGNFAIGGGFKVATSPKTFRGTYYEAYVLSPGDLLVTMTDLSKAGDTLGLPAVVPDDGNTYLHNQRIGRVRIIDPKSVAAKFLSYYLRTDRYRQHILSTASGSTVRHTSPTRIADFRAELPPFEMQLAIAEVLGALDDKIAANSRVVAGSGELMRMLASVTEPHVPLRTIVDVARITRSPSDVGAEQVWHYSLPAFDNGREPAWDIASDIKSAKFVLDRPCVLVSKLNPRFPRVWDVPTMPVGESFSSTEFVVLHPTSCSTSVLWALLSQTDFGSVLQGKVSGTSGSHQRVKPADLLATVVIDPRAIPAKVQAQVTTLGSLTNQMRHESRQLRDVRDALLPHLMSGKLRVQDAEKQIEAVV